MNSKGGLIIMQKGFTVTELLISLTIILILITATVSTVSGSVNKSKVHTASIELMILSTEVNEFFIDNKKVYNESKFMDYISYNLIKTRDSSGIIEFNTVDKKDPWKNPYILRITDLNKVDLISKGPDEVGDGSGHDDILIEYNVFKD